MVDVARSWSSDATTRTTTAPQAQSVRRPRLPMRHVPPLAVLVLALAWAPLNAQDVDILGSWRGTSRCVDKAHFPACRDEQVIYDVQRKGSARDTVTLRADKVINGAREFMGEFDFARAPDSSWVAEYQNPRVRLRIVLRVRAARMTGSLTDQLSGRRVRELALERAGASPQGEGRPRSISMTPISKSALPTPRSPTTNPSSPS